MNPKLILHNEPIRRGDGKAHILQEAYRTGGERVSLCIREISERDVLERKGNTAWHSRAWKNTLACRVANDDPQRDGVYARGAVRHLDHKTITLHGWHRVLMSAIESETRTMQPWLHFWIEANYIGVLRRFTTAALNPRGIAPSVPLFAPVAQSIARRASNSKVAGANPAGSTTFFNFPM